MCTEIITPESRESASNSIKVVTQPGMIVSVGMGIYEAYLPSLSVEGVVAISVWKG